jgi:hypothetical protein
MPSEAIPVAGSKVLITGNHNRKGAVGTVTGVHSEMLTVHLDSGLGTARHGRAGIGLASVYISCRPDQVRVLGSEELGGEG